MSMQKASVVWEGPLSAKEVADEIQKTLFGTHVQKIPYEALRAEAIRVAVWMLTASKQQEHFPEEGAATRQVLMQARILLSSLHQVSRTERSGLPENDAEDQMYDVERDVLDALEDQGDLFSLPGGYWLPAPPRLVPLGNLLYLFAGGMPIYLRPALQKYLYLHGTFRQVRDVSLQKEAFGTWQFQSKQQWLGPKPPTLQQLYADFLKCSLLPVSQQEGASRGLEAYACQSGKTQATRWRLPDNVADGRYLLRTQVQWGKRQYSIGLIQNRRLVEQSSTMPFLDIRRLCYALDHSKGMPTSVEWAPTQGKLTLRSEFPMRERKELASIATLQVPDEGYYPRSWIIPREHHETLKGMLQDLGIRVLSEGKKM